MLHYPIGGSLSGTVHILKKKVGKSNKGIFENFLKKFALSQEKKVRSRQI
jgi:hypothetical protein